MAHNEQYSHKQPNTFSFLFVLLVCFISDLLLLPFPAAAAAGPPPLPARAPILNATPHLLFLTFKASEGA